MNRRTFIKLLSVSGGTTLFTSYHACIKPDENRPNIIFFFIDDLGWKDVGFMGSNFYETPNIDRLSREGMVFTNAYANAPNCAPTRASLMTGQYPPRHGIYTVGSSERGKSENRKLIPTSNKTILEKDKLTIADVLKTAGYKSASMGKWHLGEAPDTGPIAQGFDVNIGGYTAGNPQSYFSPYNNKYLKDGPEGEYLTDRLTEEAEKFIEENNNIPFFLYFAHYAVHTPIQAKKEITAKYLNKPFIKGQNNPEYAAMIESVDQNIGRILNKLRQLKIEQNTIVIFFSDNGGHGAITSMDPLRGSKGMLYEGGIRVPLIIKWPNEIKAGNTCDEPVIGLDFFPTFLDILKLPLPKNHILDGLSILPLMKQEGGIQRESLFWHFPAYLEAYRGMTEHWRTTPAGAIRNGEWKLIEFFEDGKLELYHLKEDIGESNNLALEYPEKTKELYYLLKSWQQSIIAPVPKEKNPEYKP